MLAAEHGIARQHRDAREVIGQPTQVTAATLFKCLWVPVGNAGGANVSALRPVPVPPELRAILDADGD